MNEESEPKTLLEAVRYFSDRETCRRYMQEIKWPDGKVTCPKCGWCVKYVITLNTPDWVELCRVIVVAAVLAAVTGYLTLP